MKVIGYSQQLSVHPGGQVDFLVSCETEQYHADIVKLIHGDTDPEGPGFKIEPVHTGIDADFPGRTQRIHAGSHVLVDDHPLLQVDGSFSLQVFIAPTTPEKGVQGLLPNGGTVGSPVTDCSSATTAVCSSGSGTAPARCRR